MLVVKIRPFKTSFVSGLYIDHVSHKGPPGKLYHVRVYRRHPEGFTSEIRSYWTTRKRIGQMLVAAHGNERFQFGSEHF